MNKIEQIRTLLPVLDRMVEDGFTLGALSHDLIEHGIAVLYLGAPELVFKAESLEQLSDNHEAEGAADVVAAYLGGEGPPPAVFGDRGDIPELWEELKQQEVEEFAPLWHLFKEDLQEASRLIEEARKPPVNWWERLAFSLTI